MDRQSPDHLSSSPHYDTAPGSAPVSSTTEYERAKVALQNERQKRRSRPFLTILLLVIVVLLAAAGGALGYKYYRASSTKPASEPSTVKHKPTEVSSKSAAELITELKMKLHGTVVPTTIDLETGVAMTDDHYGAYSAPAERVDGYDFYTTPKSISGVTVATNDTEVSQADYHIATDFLDSQNMNVVSSNFDENNLITISFDGTNTSCSLSTTKNSQKQGNTQLHIGCADMSAYHTATQTASPLYESLPGAQKKPGLRLNVTTITASKTKGYQIGSANTADLFAPMGGVRALFYQTPEKQWHYFASYQDQPLCSDFNATDLKKAFLGYPCVDSSTQKPSTVSL